MSRLQMKTSKAIRNPKLFVSYSWSNPAHQEWVIDLATKLTECGVDVILDKWALQVGHDAIKFMEKMVAGPEIEKVIMIFDEVYASKANDRSGGVGTETQIISQEIYENQEQDKFAAIIAEKNDKGEPYLPTYYKSRIYIDLSDPGEYESNFERLVRWIYNKPLDVKPEIGKRPTFLDESEGISLGTTAMFNRVVSAIKENKSFASGDLDEYLTAFSTNLEKFRITETDGEFDDKVIENIKKFLSHRNEIISVFIKIAQYMPTEENLIKVHGFFEMLIPYMSKPEHVNIWDDCSADNFKFIIHELFLYLIAVLLKHEKFIEVNILLTRPYYRNDQLENDMNPVVGFGVFENHVGSLKRRNNRLNCERLSLHADLLKQRKNAIIEFRHLRQADFVLFMRAGTHESGGYSRWLPVTWVYSIRSPRAFEIFARSVSKAYFDKAKCILGIDKPSDLQELMESYRSGERRVPSSRWESLNPSMLLGYDQLATKP